MPDGLYYLYGEGQIMSFGTRVAVEGYLADMVKRGKAEDAVVIYGKKLRWKPIVDVRVSAL